MPKFLNNVDLNKNELKNVLVDKVASDPASALVSGWLIYNTTANVLKFYNGSIWVAASGGAVADGTYGEITVSASGATWTINNDAIVTAKILNGNVTTAKIADANITFAKIQNLNSMTVIGRTAGSPGVSSEVSILDEDNMATNSATALATQQSIKAYVDNTIAALGVLVGGYDPPTFGGVFPISGAVKGDYWYITAAGSIGTTNPKNVNIGDVIIANVNSPADNSNDWTILEVNREQATTTIVGVTRYATGAEALGLSVSDAALTPNALASVTSTETRTGIAEIATQGETNTGTDDTRIVSPLKLATNLASRKFSKNNAAGASEAITHSLGTLDVLVQVYEIGSPFKQVFPDITYTDANTTTITYSTVSTPGAGIYRIVISAL
jgi:hypothetical protein